MLSDRKSTRLNSSVCPCTSLFRSGFALGVYEFQQHGILGHREHGNRPMPQERPGHEDNGCFRSWGKRMDPAYFDEFVFRRIAAKAGLPGVRFHDLRHFFASMLIAQGESAKYVCDQMGHSSIQVTFDTYGHLFPNSRETAAKKLQQAMFTGRKERTGSSLVAKPRKRGRKTAPRGEED